MRKLLHFGTAYFVYEIIFVSLVFLVLFLLATGNKPFELKEKCDVVTGSCISTSNDIKIKEVNIGK